MYNLQIYKMILGIFKLFVRVKKGFNLRNDFEILLAWFSTRPKEKGINNRVTYITYYFLNSNDIFIDIFIKLNNFHIATIKKKIG